MGVGGLGAPLSRGTIGMSSAVRIGTTPEDHTIMAARSNGRRPQGEQCYTLAKIPSSTTLDRKGGGPDAQTQPKRRCPTSGPYAQW